MSEEGKVLEPEVLSPGQADAITRAEVDMAVETAHRYPRNVRRFHEEMEDLISEDEELCQTCYYSLERGGKLIQGPSIRFAEAVVHSWRNTMTGVRLIGESADRRMVIVQGAGMDLERGTRYSEEVARRITNSKGERYNDDMIAVTIRAASAIARREIYLRLVPPAFYMRHFNAARAVVVGGDLDHEGRVHKLAERARTLGATREYLLMKVGRGSLADLTEKDLLHLWGVLNAVDDGMLSLAEAFPGRRRDEGARASDVVAAAAGGAP